MNYTYVYKYEKPLKIKIFSSLILMWAIFWVQAFIFRSVGLGLFSLIFFLYQSGIEIDFEKKKYRNALFLGNIVFGEWNNLPDINYISVFRTTFVSSIAGRSNTVISSREKVVLINLIYDKNKQLKVFLTLDKEEAFNKAKYFSEMLKV